MTNPSPRRQQPLDLPVEQLVNEAVVYQRLLKRAKQATSIAPRQWYPYDTLGELYQLSELLEGEDRNIGRLLSQGPILDLCCGDGDLAFYLASQGFTVDAVDWPQTNYNRMAGVRALQSALNSPVRISEANLDTDFILPRPFYNFIFFMGALYHLKNPLPVLSRIAQSCDYSVLTTRVTRYAADRKTDIGHLPVAYLVDSAETNDDDTNYWIFTQAGLRRALTRTNWRISSMMTRGAADSDPASPQGDQRAYCFLRSVHCRFEFLDGVHYLESEEWQWTEKHFRLRIWHTPSDTPTLILPLFLPPESLAILGTVTVHTTVNSVALPPVIFDQPGCYDIPIPARLLNPDSTIVEVHADKAIPPDDADFRERALVVRTRDPNQAL